MSWSVSLIGKPAAVVQALEDHSATWKDGDASRIEYEAAKPHLIGIVRQNFAKPESGYTEPVITLSASGHGYVKDGEMVQCNLTVEIKPSYHKLV